MDVHNAQQRSFNMSRIRGKDTKPEIMIREWLWANGLRYRINKKDLPGKPDIVLPKFNTVIFVHGCFWHRHSCQLAATPGTRRDFWLLKLNKNAQRDKSNYEKLLAKGWRVAIIWECALKRKKGLSEEHSKKLKDWIFLGLSKV